MAELVGLRTYFRPPADADIPQQRGNRVIDGQLITIGKPLIELLVIRAPARQRQRAAPQADDRWDAVTVTLGPPAADAESSENAFPGTETRVAANVCRTSPEPQAALALVAANSPTRRVPASAKLAGRKIIKFISLFSS